MRWIVLLSAACFAVLACGSSKDEDVELMSIVPLDLFQVPDPLTADCIECDMQRDGDEGMHLCWAQRRDAGVSYDIYYAHGHTSLELNTSIVRVTDTAADSRHPAIAVNVDGDVTIVWEEGTSPSRAISTAFRAAGSGSFGPMGEFAPSTSDNANPHFFFDLFYFFREGGPVGQIFSTSWQIH